MPSKRSKQSQGAKGAKQQNPVSGALAGDSSLPVALATRQGFKGPSPRQSWRFPMRERIASINGTSSSTVPTVTTYSINPGLAASFPWLGGEADRWEQYTFLRLTYEWIPATGSSGTGFAAIVPEYDASDPNPTTIDELVNTADSQVCRVWEHFFCPLKYSSMHALGPRRFIRSTLVAGDIKTFDVGKIHIATWGQGNTNAAGEIWADYEIELYVPQKSGSSTGAVANSTSFYQHTASQTFVTTVGEPVEFETALTDPLGIGNDAVGVFTPPAGAFDIHAICTFADSSAETFTATLELFKNGAALSTRVLNSVTVTNPAAGTVVVALRGYVSCNGTDTFQIQATLTGAAGTLTSPTLNGQLVIRLA